MARGKSGRVSMAALKRHADEFGVAGVVEAAMEMGYGDDVCVDLLAALDVIERKQWESTKKRRALGLVGYAPKYRKGTAERVAEMRAKHPNPNVRNKED